jgi:hypothetical protein
MQIHILQLAIILSVIGFICEAAWPFTSGSDRYKAKNLEQAETDLARNILKPDSLQSTTSTQVKHLISTIVDKTDTRRGRAASASEQCRDYSRKLTDLNQRTEDVHHHIHHETKQLLERLRYIDLLAKSKNGLSWIIGACAIGAAKHLCKLLLSQ